MGKWSIRFRHLFRLTDDVGILEHAHYLLPRRSEGYTTDDNARALLTVLTWADLLPPSSLRDRLLGLSERYLAFLTWAAREDGRFHNNFSYAREKELEHPSDDCDARALYALAHARYKMPHQAHRELSRELYLKALPHAFHFKAPRAMAYALATVSTLLEADPVDLSHTERTLSLQLLETLSTRLLRLYDENHDQDWRWFEPHLTYANALLPWSLWRAQTLLGDEAVRHAAKDSLDFLIDVMTTGDPPHLRPVGNDGWGDRTKMASWDQQPLEIFKIALAASAAWEQTGEARYWQVLQLAHGWFYGQNTRGVMMINELEGAAYDGLTPGGPNANAGAEALLSYLMTEATWIAAQKKISPGLLLNAEGDDTVNIEAETQALLTFPPAISIRSGSSAQKIRRNPPVRKENEGPHGWCKTPAPNLPPDS